MTAERQSRLTGLLFNDGVELVPMTLAYAADVVTWRYPAPYGCYDMVGTATDFLADPANCFYALVESDELIGFRSFGSDGQVPGGSYDTSALDTGGGLRADLVGNGHGQSAIEVGLAFGRRHFDPAAFRVTVATFNTRALRVLHRCGFTPIDQFNAATDGRPYEVLVG
jgi:RimJ/RimL family protein N-acetyltransferase